MSLGEEDGSTLRDHLENVKKLTGKTPEQLIMPEFPEMCVSVWEWFLKLHSRRTYGGFSANPITYSEMKAFFDLECIIPQPWEIKGIIELDTVMLSLYNKKEKSKQNKTK